MVKGVGPVDPGDWQCLDSAAPAHLSSFKISFSVLLSQGAPGIWAHILFDVFFYNQGVLGLLLANTSGYISALVFLATRWRLGAWLRSPRELIFELCAVLS